MRKEEIRVEIEKKQKELEELQKELSLLSEEIKISWIGSCDPRQHGKPYLAILTKDEDGKKYSYNFLPTVEEGLDKNKYVKATFRGNLKIGTILRGRVGGSWKNDYTHFYIVKETGLVKITENEVLKYLGILK